MKKILFGFALAAYSTAFSLEPACTLTPNSEGVYEVANYEQLRVVPYCPSDGTYRLVADIDASPSVTQNCVFEGECEGFTPIGNDDQPFTGLFDGNGHVISDLWIQRSSSNTVGFIGNNEGNIQSLGLENASVQGSLYVGLLVGENRGGVDQCYVTGMVKGHYHVGGLVGVNRNVIKNSYAKADIRPLKNGSGALAGFVGFNGGSLTQNYAEATFTGFTNQKTAGLVAENGPKEGYYGALGTMSDNYWNADLNESTGSNINGSGSSTSPIGSEQAVGLSTIEMYQKTSYSDWDFENTWVLYEGHTAPLLRAFMVPVTVSVETVEKVYDALPLASPTVTFSPIPDKPELLLGAPEFSVGSTVDVGSYELYVSGGLYSTQLGYALSFDKTATLTITPAPLTVMAHDHNKVYGESDPALSYYFSGLLRNDDLPGKLSREPGENVGDYRIELGTVGNSNYDIAFTGATLKIEPAPLTVTARSQSKVYGESDPELSYTETGLVEGDPLNVLLNREEGEDVGHYAIAAKAILATKNYTLDFVGSSLEIKPATLTVTANSLTKIYGESDPVLSYTATGLVEGDPLNVVLKREEGEDVGHYAISAESVLATKNYTLGFVGSSLEIKPAPLTVTANSLTKIYGESDPVLSYTVSGLLGNDVLTGTLSRESGENVGDYLIEQGMVGNSNYDIAFTGAALNIDPAPLAVTANSLTKTYGESDPELSYTVSGLLGNDVLTGTLSRESGENVGDYLIEQGTLGNSNYDIAFTGGTLNIDPAPLRITVLNDTLEWGTVPPSVRFEFVGFVADEDSTALSLLHVTHDTLKNEGNYPLRLEALASNYVLTLVDGIRTVTAPVGNLKSNPFLRRHVQMLDNGVMVAGYRGPLHVYSLQGKRMASLNITHDGFYAMDLAPGHYRVR